MITVFISRTSPAIWKGFQTEFSVQLLRPGAQFILCVHSVSLETLDRHQARVQIYCFLNNPAVQSQQSLHSDPLEKKEERLLSNINDLCRASFCIDAIINKEQFKSCVFGLKRWRWANTELEAKELSNKNTQKRPFRS